MTWETPPRGRNRPIYIVSDGTGGTAEKVVRAAMAQFTGHPVHIQVYPTVTDPEQLERIARRAAEEDAMLVCTLVRPDVRRTLRDLAQEHRVRMVDLLGNLLSQLGLFFHAQPDGVPNRLYIADEDYFRRVAAVEFTVKADDGKEPRLLREAEIVLVGVSRTSKTPLSVFLAHKGYRVSNVPIVFNKQPPDTLFELDQRCIFGLTIDPESLQNIRQERLATMRMASRTNYGDMDYILAELEWSEELFRQNPQWPVIDVTRRAVEETAAIILKIMGERGLTHVDGEAGQL